MKALLGKWLGHPATGLSVVLGLYLAAPQSAYAMHDCGPMQIRVGTSGRNPVAHTTVGVTYDGHWTVIHHMQDGTDYDRDAQYHMNNLARSDGGFEWYGFGTVHPNNEMHGILFPQNGRIRYQEIIFDTAHNRKIVDDTTQDCGEINPAPHYDPPQAPAPTYSPPPSNSAPGDVPIIVDNNEALIVVMIGGRSLGMTLDTGASLGQLPTEFANALIADGAATEGEPKRFQMANGAVETNRTVIVNSIVIGSHTIYNVRFGVGSAALLGFNALSAVGTFKIDPVRGVLSFS
jgi:hypothetical protein